VNGITKLLVCNNGGVVVGTTATPSSNGLYVLGNTGLGTNTPGYKLDVNGTVNINNVLSVQNTTDHDYSDPNAIETYSGTGYAIVARSSYRNGIAILGYSAPSDLYYPIGISGQSGYIGVSGFASSDAYGVGVEGTATGYQSAGVAGYGEWYGISGSGGTYAGYFLGDVLCTGTYLNSDAKLKKNMAPVDNAVATDIINKLQPKYYEYRTDSDYARMHLPVGKHYGFIAQDIEKVLPGLVKQSEFDVTAANKRESFAKAQKSGNKINTDSSVYRKKEVIDFKAVNYTELIPIMVKAMQEMNVKNDAKDKQIADLQNQINDLKLLISKTGNNANTSNTGYLKQNVPNPTGNNTTISYYLPDNISNSQIIISDVKGSTIKTYTTSRGIGQISLRNSELPAGVYNYTLYANDKIIDSKQMIISK
jgi:hypothetical protein